MGCSFLSSSLRSYCPPRICIPSSPFVLFDLCFSAFLESVGVHLYSSRYLFQFSRCFLSFGSFLLSSTRAYIHSCLSALFSLGFTLPLLRFSSRFPPVLPCCISLLSLSSDYSVFFLLLLLHRCTHLFVPLAPRIPQPSFQNSFYP